MDNVSFWQKNNSIYIIFFLAFSFRAFLSSLNFGGGDAHNLSSFYALQFNSFNLYSTFGVSIPYPYLPFANFVNLTTGQLADFFLIHFHVVNKNLASFFDLLIGSIIYLYYSEKNPSKAIAYFTIYAFNPLTIFINCFLGFTDSLVIFTLILSCYLADCCKKNNYLIPVLLAISISIKPYTFLFLPIFFLRSQNRLWFLFYLLVTLLFLNSFYIFNEINISYFQSLLDLIYKKIIWGHQTSYHGLGLIRQKFGAYFYFLPYIKIIKALGVLLILALNLLIIKNIKTYKFVFYNFFIIFLFTDHLHLQYFIWIIPFIFLFKFDKKSILLIGCLTLISLIYSIKWVEESGVGLFLFLEKFNLLSKNVYLNGTIFDKTSILLIIIFYYSLIINKKFSLKLIKRLLHNFRYKNKFNLGKLILGYFSAENYLKKNTFKFLKVTNLILIFISLIFLYNFKTLYKMDKKVYVLKNENFISQIDKNIFELPDSLLRIQHGSKIKYKTKYQYNGTDNVKVKISTEHFYTLKLNNKKIYRSFGYKYEDEMGGKSMIFFKEKYLTISKYLNKNSNDVEINVYNLNPNKISSFYFELFENENKKNDNLIWQASIENKNLKKKKIFNSESNRFNIVPDLLIKKSLFDNKFIIIIILIILYLLINFIYKSHFKKIT